MKGSLNTLQLYNKLESNFRALEFIGMTADKYTAMLFPLVKSCIPEEHVKSYILEFILLSCLRGRFRILGGRRSL